jgi:IclR family pca regulon transcriptional regulator
LRQELARVRHQGWYILDQDFEEGVRSATAPIRDVNGKVIASIGASVHAGRLTVKAMQNEFLPHILQAANSVTADLSSHPSNHMW